MKSLPPSLCRYFIAIIPPTLIFEEVLWLKNYFKEKYSSKASLKSPPHITIQAPFLWSESRENELVKLLEYFAKDKRSIQVSLSGFGAFSPRVIFIAVDPTEELNDFHTVLEEFCRQKLNLTNNSDELKNFHPHLTLAFRDLRKDQFDLAWREFKNKKYSASFTVDGFHLLKHDGQKWQSLYDFHF